MVYSERIAHTVQLLSAEFAVVVYVGSDLKNSKSSGVLLPFVIMIKINTKGPVNDHIGVGIFYLFLF